MALINKKEEGRVETTPLSVKRKLVTTTRERRKNGSGRGGKTEEKEATGDKTITG